MPLASRLLRNATTTYARLAITFAIGLFTTWYILGAVGVIGFGLIALGTASSGPSRAIEQALRVGLVRELSAAVASGDPRRIRGNFVAAMVLCMRTAFPLGGLVLIFAAAAWAGLFNTPGDGSGLGIALAVLILGEGGHNLVRLLGAPYLQSLFAAQLVGLDNVLMVLARLSTAIAALLVFGLVLPDASLTVQLFGYALSRTTLQVVDVPLGIWIARRRFRDLRLDRSAFRQDDYATVRGTVWHSAQVEILLSVQPQLLAILINLFFGVAYNGIWQVVVQFSGYARMFAESLLRGIEPLTTHLQESGRMDRVVELMRRSVRYQFAAVLPIAVFLGVYARPLLELWVGGRLGADPGLVASGITASSALGIAARLAVIMLTARAVRAGFYGVERILYGLGQVRSYAWFAKWATVITLGLGTALMYWTRVIEAAPVALLVSYTLFSCAVVMPAARREIGLPLARTLGRALPGPVFASAVLFAMLAAARRYLGPDLTVSMAVGLLVASCVVYVILALVIVALPDERHRLMRMIETRVIRRGESRR